jgi:hypothetical protein
MQAELHFGKAEARVIDGDAVIAGERHFEAAAKAIAVDDRNGHAWQLVEPVQHRVAAGQQRFNLRRIGDAAKLRDVSAGDEAARLCRANDNTPWRFTFELIQDCVQLGQHFFRQRVGAGVPFVEQ